MKKKKTPTIKTFLLSMEKRINKKFSKIDKKFEEQGVRFDKIDQKFAEQQAYIDNRFIAERDVTRKEMLNYMVPVIENLSQRIIDSEKRIVKKLDDFIISSKDEHANHENRINNLEHEMHIVKRAIILKEG